MRKIISLFLCCMLLAGCSTALLSKESMVPTTDKFTTQAESPNTSEVPMITEPAEKEKLPEEIISPEMVETVSTVTSTETELLVATELSEPSAQEKLRNLSLSLQSRLSKNQLRHPK